MIEQRFPIGTTYAKTFGASKNSYTRNYTVTDVHRTYNNAGELVKLRYVVEHPFANQILTDYDVSDTTIAMNNPVLPEVKP